MVRIAIAAIVAIVLALSAAALLRWHQHRAAQRADVPTAVDIGFAQAMIQHHDQAVLMSQILLQGEKSRLFGIAWSIQTTQLVQIGQMRGWLQSWSAPPLSSRRSMDWMLSASKAPDAELLEYVAHCRGDNGMPGMASGEQLQQLREAQGTERDRLFLQLMIRHHLGALPMAHFAARWAGTTVVRALASQIAFDQGSEIQQMRLLLRSADARH